jgi:hypothetical protein
MDRSLYPEGVEVHQRDLARTETTKAFHIIERHQRTSNMGLVSGSVVLNAGDATLINVNPVFGFVPNGEIVETAVITPALALADYANGAINYVTAVYTEVNEELQPHETESESQPTSAVRSARIRVFTETEYTGLPDTDDNLNNDAADRALVIARVTGKGVGIALTNDDIEPATPFPSAITAVNTTENITGTVLSNIDKTTNTGTGSLQFEFAAQEIKWKAPGDSAFGAATSLPTSGIFDVISPSGKILTLIVVKSSLPLSDQTDTIVVSNIYSQSVNRHTSEDEFHRSLLGSGTPTLTNPHGLTLQDLGSSSGIVEIHQDEFHSNGIIKQSAATCLECSINTGSVPHEIDVVDPTGDDKFFLNGNEFTSIQTNTITFTDLTDDAHAIFNIYVVEGIGGVAILERRERVRFTNASPPPFVTTYLQLVNISDDVPATAAARVQFDDGADTLEFDSGTGNFGTPVSIPSSDGIVRLYDENDQYFIDVNVRASIAGVGTQLEGLTISTPLTEEEAEARLLLAAVLFSGSATGFAGYGFGAANSPNDVVDGRLFGTLGVDNIRDDVGVLDIIKVPGSTSIIKTEKTFNIGLSALNSTYKVNVKATDTNQNGLRSESNGNGVGITGVASGTNHAIYGYSSGSGSGVIGYNAGTGHGITARADVTSPVRSSLLVMPQDTAPTNKASGSWWTKTASGKPYHSNGLAFEQVLTRSFVSTADSSIHTGTLSETAFDVAYTIPANTLQVGSVIRVRAMISVLNNGGNTTDAISYLWLGAVGGPIDQRVGGTKVEMSADYTYMSYFDLTVVIRSIGSSGTYIAYGHGGHANQTASTGSSFIYPKGISTVRDVNTTADLDTTVSIALTATGQQVVLRNLIVEVSG